MPVDRWQWVAPDGRRGAKWSSRAAAIQEGVTAAMASPRGVKPVREIDPDLATVLWRSMEATGWKLEVVAP